MAYNFYWNEKNLIVELLETQEDGSLAKLGELRFNKEEGVAFAKKVMFYCNTKLSASKDKVVEPNPLPDDS